MNVEAFESFSRAILDPERALDELPLGSLSPEERQLRFAVYRNNSVVALLEHLEAVFPALSRLVGGEYFKALAGEFLRRSPPTQPVLQEYGAEFPGFIEAFPPLRDFPYLGDVARLEWARQLAFYAADQDTLSVQALRANSVPELLLQAFPLHPSVQGLASRHPVLSLWRSQWEESPEAGAGEWQPEQVVVWRQDYRLSARALGAMEWRFFLALQAGQPLAVAIQQAHGGTLGREELSALTQLFTQWVQDGWFRALPKQLDIF